ncbi:STM3941 family protein [Erythrobacter colymbi]|uniref:STM3941 family protein n=1 Tax=Erythrobacter colymbi TaxID=1161202 RepID=UPI000A3AF1DF|nr:STM3941 family protein [Erythrobacter colymbi]
MPEVAAESAPEPFVARYSVPKLLVWIIGPGGMALLGWVFAAPALRGGNLVVAAACALGVLFFGGIAAMHALRLFDRRPQMVIDGQGLYVRSHGETRIPLRSIKSVHSDSIGQISMTLHKPAKYPIETRHRRFIYRINGSAARGFFGDVWVRTSVLDCSQDALLGAMAAHRPMTEFEKQLEERIAASR